MILNLSALNKPLMDQKPLKTKNSLSYHKPKLSEKFPDIIPEIPLSQKNSSKSVKNSLKKDFPSSSTGKLPNSIYSSKFTQGIVSEVARVKRLPRSHINSLQLTPKSRILSKDKLFHTEENGVSRMNPTMVLTNFKNVLTEYEKTEILQYDDIYYFGKIFCKNKNKDAFDDDRGDYLYKVSDHIAYRYEILSLLGIGNFGQVLLCRDHKRNSDVAIKITRNKKRFTKQAAVEIKVLSALKENDKEGKKSVVKLKTYFVFRKHVCMVFDVMSMNLFELIKRNHFKGFSIGLIRKFTLQILNCLELSSRLGIIHCDLKPENIMLVSEKSANLKVIDFGTSCFENEKIYNYIQSRFYRSPEIILGIPYSTSIDMWSLGCIVSEFFTGTPLFTGSSEHEQIHYFLEVLGLPPAHVLKVSSKTRQFFDKNGNPVNVEGWSDAGLPGSRPVEHVLYDAPDDLIDFVKKCLEWDPSLRLRPSEALRHPFIAKKRKKSRVKRISKAFEGS
jgi:dual specificity tyrosine-phosphorylation-regulated kinase 2/3/4